MRFLLLTALPITPQSKVSKCVSMSMYRSIAVCEPVRKIVFFNKRTVQIPTTQCPAYVSTSEQKSLRVEVAAYEPVTGTTSFVSRTPCVNMCCEFFTPNFCPAGPEYEFPDELRVEAGYEPVRGICLLQVTNYFMQLLFQPLK